MENKELLKQVTSKANIWLAGNYDTETKAAVQSMLDNSDKTELMESFYKDLEFGTGGLRGIMGVGTNRINKYTIGAATQGLSGAHLARHAQRPQVPRHGVRAHALLHPACAPAGPEGAGAHQGPDDQRR